MQILERNFKDLYFCNGEMEKWRIIVRVLYYDVFCGISGDMHLGALLDLGVPMDYIREMLALLPLGGEFSLDYRRAEKMGITGVKANVYLTNGQYDLIEEKKHDHHHDHDHDHDHDHHHEHHHEHRAYRDIRELLAHAALPEGIKARALNIFACLAEAEAGVHGKPIEEVHFHEVGSVDAIVDIVAAAAAIEYLNVDLILCSPIHVGGGMVKCAHGVFPVPAPATTSILKGVPLTFGRVMSETTTPTGAAILKANVDKYTDRHELKIEKIGYGLGTKNFDIPNVLRVYLGVIDEVESLAHSGSDFIIEQEYIIEMNLDDMSPEAFPALENLLFQRGAKDVWKTAIFMKKNRLATQVSILTDLQTLPSLYEVIVAHSTTAGFRQYPVEKFMLKRQWQDVQTQYGTVPVKQLLWHGNVLRQKPEYDVCFELSKKHGVSLEEVTRAALTNG